MPGGRLCLYRNPSRSGSVDAPSAPARCQVPLTTSVAGRFTQPGHECNAHLTRGQTPGLSAIREVWVHGHHHLAAGERQECCPAVRTGPTGRAGMRGRGHPNDADRAGHRRGGRGGRRGARARDDAAAPCPRQRTAAGRGRGDESRRRGHPTRHLCHDPHGRHAGCAAGRCARTGPARGDGRHHDSRRDAGRLRQDRAGHERGRAPAHGGPHRPGAHAGRDRSDAVAGRTGSRGADGPGRRARNVCRDARRRSRTLTRRRHGAGRSWSSTPWTASGCWTSPSG